MYTAHCTTRCQVLSHPATNPARIFEVRRLARDAGCQYVSTSKRRTGNISSPNSFGGAA